MLVGKPWARIRRNNCEIPIFPQSPNDVPIAGPAVVVDLDLPSLVTDGYQEVAVLSGPGNGVRMQPVDSSRNRAGCACADVAQDGTAMDVQMIKCIPSPDHLKVFVQHHEKLAHVWCGCSTN